MDIFSLATGAAAKLQRQDSSSTDDSAEELSFMVVVTLFAQFTHQRQTFFFQSD